MRVLPTSEPLCGSVIAMEMPSPRRMRAQAAYIKSRTYLSRSGVMRILAELRTGNYITMERGVLIDIHHLPRKCKTR